MTPHFPTKRAAEEFDSALAGTASTLVAERHSDLLTTVRTLRSVPEVSPRAEFVEDLRSRLMLAAETDLVPAPPVVRTQRRPSRRSHRAGSVAAALVIVGGSAGMAAAANGSLPGEALYPIKRGGEQLNEAVRLSDASKGRALLGQAENRLGEAGDLMASGSGDTRLLTDTLEAFRTAADAGSSKLFVSYQRDGNAADVVEVRTFAAQQMATLTALASTSDASSAALLLDAADTLADIDQEARMLCGGCGTDSSLQTPTALAEGAAAMSTQNLLARPATQAEADITAARLASLVQHAQKTAAETPQVPQVKQGLPGTGTAASAPSTSAATGPVTSTISGSGELLPSSGGGKAVDDLVTGVTGTSSTTPKDVAGVGEALGTVTEGATGGLLP